MPEQEDSEPLMIGGRAVDPRLLEARPMRRCQVETCQSYCCSGGVWIHTRQVDDLLAHQDLIIPHLPPERRDPAQWFDGVVELDTDNPEAGTCTGTNVVPDPTHPAGQTCIFLLANRRCALQAAAIAQGEHPWRFKPFYCCLHPLVLSEGRLVYEDTSEICLEGGHCSAYDPDNVIPLYALFDVETRLVLGDEGFAALDALAQQQTGK
jgi:hypothetical protein